VDEKVRAWLRRHTHEFTAGGTVRMEGEAQPDVIWVLEGWFATEKMLPDGRRQLLDIALPCDLVQDGGGDSPSARCGVIALTDGAAACAPARAFADVFGRQAALRALVERLGTMRESRLGERMLRIGRGEGLERLAYTILELQHRLQGLGLAAPDVFEMPVTQGTLGDLNGLSNIHVCRLMKQFEEQGVIAVEGETVRILDAGALAATAGVDEDALARGTLG
jgi:CRP-like cAMP-binding protein